jgi:hypothetical protein
VARAAREVPVATEDRVDQVEMVEVDRLTVAVDVLDPLGH